MHNFLMIHSGDLNSYIETLKDISPKSTIITGDLFFGTEAKKKYFCYEFYKKNPINIFKSPVFVLGKPMKRMDKYDNIIFKSTGYFSISKIPYMTLVIGKEYEGNMLIWQFQKYTNEKGQVDILLIHQKQEEIIFTEHLSNLIYSKSPKLIIFYGNKKFKHFKYPISDTECISIGKNNTILYDINDGNLFSIV